jgi:GMP synthase (glutamine-hydrolysing)
LTDAGVTDPVLGTFEQRQQVFQWHEDGITLQPDAVHLASSPASQVQAFRYGEHAYGFQFHLEVNESLISRWLTVPENQKLLAAEQGRIDSHQIHEQTQDSIHALQALSQQTFSRWIDRFEISPRRQTLPSR